jgi:hypothetical protein
MPEGYCHLRPDVPGDAELLSGIERMSAGGVRLLAASAPCRPERSAAWFTAERPRLVAWYMLQPPEGRPVTIAEPRGPALERIRFRLGPVDAGGAMLGEAKQLPEGAGMAAGPLRDAHAVYSQAYLPVTEAMDGALGCARGAMAPAGGLVVMMLTLRLCQPGDADGEGLAVARHLAARLSAAHP